jgi:hypothetical protein
VRRSVVMKKSLSVFVVFLFLLLSGSWADAAESKRFPPLEDIKYEVIELKLIKPGEASCIIRSTDPKVQAEKGDEALECRLITDYKNDKKNGFYVNVPAKTLLKVGENINVVYTDPAFAIPKGQKSVTEGEYRFYTGETVFFEKEDAKSFAVWFY